MAKKQYLVVGLGRFGCEIAKTLFNLGNDVLVIDKNEELIEDIVDDVTHAVAVDCTDENALKALGISNFDVGIVSIGHDLEASILITLILKDLGIKYIVCKAQNDLHEKVLKKVGADKVVRPEKDMGRKTAYNLVSSSVLDYIELSRDYGIMEIEAPKTWWNKTLIEVDVRKKYNINIIGIKRGHNINIAPNGEDIIRENDVLVTLGYNASFNRFKK